MGYGILINDVLEAAELLAAEGDPGGGGEIERHHPPGPELVLESSVKKTGVLLTRGQCRPRQRGAAAGRRRGGGRFDGQGPLPHQRRQICDPRSAQLLKQELGLDSAGIFRAALEVLRSMAKKRWMWPWWSRAWRRAARRPRPSSWPDRSMSTARR
ncbi:MAG: hypothetical protein V8S34_08215 [Lawsonibacter sp.]